MPDTTKPRLSREEKAQNNAQEVLDRAERELRSLATTGMDIAALNDRYTTAKAQFDEGKLSECESLCSEVLVLAKSMGAIATASKNAVGRGGGGTKMTESLKLEVSRLVSSEVTTRVESVVRSLPSTSAIEDIVMTKIQEALVTGGLMARLESLAGEKAQAAVSVMPKFTAKDAQAAANLVVQRALTQFLASKELGTRVRAAVEVELTKAVDESMAKISQETEALVNTRVASLTAPLPTKDSMAEHVRNALASFTKDEAFEERVLELAAERAKAEVARAPDMMTEAAGRIARNEADALFKTRIQANEFTDQVKLLATEGAREAMHQMSMITPEDVEVISRRVADESLASLADSDVLREKIEDQAKSTVEGVLAEGGFDDKVKNLAREVFGEKIVAIEEKLAEASGKLENMDAGVGEKVAAIEEKLAEASGKLENMDAGIGEKVSGAVAQLEEIANSRPTKEELADEVMKVRQDIMTSQDFAEWIKDGVKAILTELGLGEGIEGLEKALVTPDKVEKMARHEALTAAMDLLETKEFTRRFVALIDEDDVRSKIEEVSGGSAGAELQAKNAFAVGLASDEFAEKVKELSGGDGAKDLSKRLIERMDRIEKEALPAIVDRMLSEKLGAAPGESVPDRVNQMVGEAVAAKIDPQVMQQQVLKIATENIKDIANAPSFKQMLDEKFKVMMKYLSADVIPKQIKRIMGG